MWENDSVDSQKPYERYTMDNERQLIYPVDNILVDTPNGTLGRDIVGFFTESPLKTKRLHIHYRYYGKSGKSAEYQSLMIFGDMMKVQSAVRTTKAIVPE